MWPMHCNVAAQYCCSCDINMNNNKDHHDIQIEENKEIVEKQDVGINGIAQQNEIKKPSRRPDIDLLRVSLTFGILVFHTVVAFTPGDHWDIRSGYPLGPVLQALASMFITSMGVWNMPMFFFLSGISAFFALFKRTKQQFRDERVHRLMVPYLVLFLFQFVYSINFFWPDCRQFYFQNETYEMEAGNENASRLTNCSTWVASRNISFSQHTRKQYESLLPGQGWFLLPLFIYSQMFAHLFCLWHPTHSSVTASGLPCCGRPICCTRPFSSCVKFFSCITCFGKPASTAEELVNSTLWWLGSIFRLGLLPGLILGLVDALICVPGYLVLEEIFYYALPPVLNPTYIFIMIFGYVITAADDHGMRDILHRGRWIYLSFGIVFNVLCSLTSIPDLKDPVPKDSDFFHPYRLIYGLIRGMSKWLLILGWYGVTRGLLTSSLPWLDHLNTMAMPFYLIHQQVLVVTLSGVLWIPYLGSFPVTLLLVSLVTGILAHLITKMTNFRYFFGLNPANDSFLPGKHIRGFVPVIFLAVLVPVLMITLMALLPL